MYVFGKQQPDVELSRDALARIIEEGHARKARFAAVGHEEIRRVLGRVGERWKNDSSFFRAAMEQLPAEIPFSREMIEATLRLIPGLVAPETTLRRLEAEFGGAEVLDRWIPHSSGARVRAFPLGLLFHVSAGNVFIGCIDSLLMGFLTKNVSIIKLSSRNQIFPRLFAESIRDADPDGIIADQFAIVHFPGGSTELESLVKEHADGIVVWGGDETMRAYREGLGAGVKLFEYGPKISFQVVSRDAFDTSDDEALAGLAARIARDISLWDQAACASPQNLFLEKGLGVEQVLDAVARALETAPFPRGQLSADEEVEILKERYRAKASALLDSGALREGSSFLLHHDPAPGLRPSPLNRTLIVKAFNDIPHLCLQLAAFEPQLQSCGYCLETGRKDEFLHALAAAGVKRFAPIGSVMDGKTGAPHDGRFGLTELVQFIPDETGETTDGGESLVDFVNGAIASVPYYHRARNAAPVRDLREMPLLSGSEMTEHTLPRSRDFIRTDAMGGYVFSSGGTAGNPKYTFYTHEEFEEVGRMLAKGLRAQGLKPGDTVANLFVAGNMWSSFLAISRAIAQVGAVELPIGGMAEPDLILSYLQAFRPRAVFGLPAFLVSLAVKSAAASPAEKPQVPIVFYAGEHLNTQARDYLAREWGTKRFCSAGYASVDAGPIGYQCPHCGPGEHHLFADQVHLEIVEDEGVVTSKVRRAMPIIRYRTGDRIELLDGSCPCGSSDPRFLLRGRCDSQINIWGCRIHLHEIEKAIGASDVRSAIFQVVLENTEDGGEKMTLLLETETPGTAEPQAAVTRQLWESSLDLQKTHPPEWLAGRFFCQLMGPGSIPRLARTGKIRSVDDRRND